MATNRDVRTLLTRALRHPDTEEGIACAGTALESRTVKAGGKAFVFFEPKGARLKLDASLAEAKKRAAKEPARYRAGAGGWVFVAFVEGALPVDVLGPWIDESYALMAGAKKPAKSAPKKKKPRAKQTRRG